MQFNLCFGEIFYYCLASKIKKKTTNFWNKERCVCESIIFISILLFFKADYFPFSKTIYPVILQTPYFPLKDIGTIWTPDERMIKSVPDQGSFLKRAVRLLLRKILMKGKMKINTFPNWAFQKKFLQKNI